VKTLQIGKARERLGLPWWHGVEAAERKYISFSRTVCARCAGLTGGQPGGWGTEEEAGNLDGGGCWEMGTAWIRIVMGCWWPRLRRGGVCSPQIESILTLVLQRAWVHSVNHCSGNRDAYSR
jgi:hypothetical protein